jgi:hypothetical protein
MPGYWSTTICLPLVGGLGRRAPTRNSIELTGIGPHSLIYTLNDDALLNIFYLYRLDIKDEADDDGVYRPQVGPWMTNSQILECIYIRSRTQEETSLILP